MDASVAASGIGVSWQEAFKIIHEAVNAASGTEKDEIWIRNGEYILSDQINIDKVLDIYGGFAGVEAQIGQRAWGMSSTIVDGNCVVRCFYISSKCTLDGLTIRNGRSAEAGAGLTFNQRLFHHLRFPIVFL